MQPQVGPAFQEVSQISERIQAQAVIPIVGKMGHKYTDLQKRRKREIEFSFVRSSSLNSSLCYYNISANIVKYVNVMTLVVTPQCFL